MKVRVINLRTTLDPKAVYVGRGSPLGNPFSVVPPQPGVEEVTREQSIERFTAWFKERLKDRESEQFKAVWELARRLAAGEEITLSCYCHPEPCHAEVIAAAVEFYAGRILEKRQGREWDQGHGYGYSDEAFKKRLDESHPWQEWVAQFLRLNGLAVEVAPYAFRERVDQAAEFTRREKDLWLPGCGLYVEVKTRPLAFTHPGDFPHADLIVDTLKGFERKAQKPLAYVIVSRLSGAMLALPTSTRPAWTARELKDAERGIRDTFLLAPRDACRDMGWLVSLLKTVEGQPDAAAYLEREFGPFARQLLAPPEAA